MRQGDRGRDRLAALDAAVREAGLDLMVIVGRGVISHYGYLYFAAQYAPVIRMGAVLIQPGYPPVLVLTSASDCALARPQTPIEDIRLLSLDAPAADPGSLAALVRERLDGLEAPRLGVVGIEDIVQARLWDALRGAAPAARIVSATALMQRLKAVKTPEDIDGLRASAALADDSLDALVRTLRNPLATLQAAAGAAAASLYTGGASEILIYASKGPDYLHRPRAERLEDGDLLTVFVECSTADGYWIELARLISRGRLDRVRAKQVEDGLAVMDAAARELRPGPTGGDAYEALASMIHRQGYSSGLWLGHGVGVDHDLPTIGDGDDTQMQADMTVAFHPHLVDASGAVGSSLGDTFLITPEGGQALSRWPRDLIRL